MRTTIIIVLALGAASLAYWWFIYRPAHLPLEGSNCKAPGGFPGKIKNGACVPLGIGTGILTPIIP